MKTILKYHISALLLASVFSLSFIIFLTQSTLPFSKSGVKKIHTTKQGINSYTSSLSEGEDAELNFIWSLQEKKGVTLLGSSELSFSSPFVCHDYVSNKLNLRVSSFGHQHFQSFAMYCSLLAFKENIRNSNICIIVSPGWFDKGGTNIEAFLEYVKPPFLDRIIKDEHISHQEKLAIGSYLYRNRYLINHPDKRINYFINLFKFEHIPYLRDYFINRKNEFIQVEYPEFKGQSNEGDVVQIEWEKVFKELETNFVKSVHSNSYFINDDYYNEFLKENYDHGEFKDPGVENQELKDVLLLVGFLKKNGSNVSVVIQNLNPYHYNNLESFNPALNEMKDYFEKNNIAYLNMFTADSKDYVPGTLDDIMHTGHLGWMKINKFLVDTYGEKK